MSKASLPRWTVAVAGAAALTLCLSACADTSADTDAGADASATGPTSSPAAEQTTPQTDAMATGPTTDETSATATEDAMEAMEATEMAARTPRVVVTYDGGLVVLDAGTLETEADLPLDGFNRLNAVGDGRHVAVSTTGGFASLDAGTWSEPHGDHDHYYTAPPALHDVLIEAEAPAHVVVHDGLTAFFDDGTGDVTVVETSGFTDMVEHGHVHAVREYTTEHPHHGVAVATAAGELLVTRGDEDGRTGAMLLDSSGEVLVSSDECPGVHGETASTDGDGEDFILTGCEDGVLVFRGGDVQKLDSPDGFGRIGNAHSVEGSNVVLGDYRSDPEGGIGLARIALVDVTEGRITVADPFDGADAEYTWRGQARGSDGEMLVLGTDGALRVLDPGTGEVDRTIEVTGAWDVPEEWQTPHPALLVLDDMAYVTEPATGIIHVVDYAGGEVARSVEVGVQMNEIAGVTG